MLTLEEFAAYLDTELELNGSPLGPETRFVEDLDFDSVRMLELSIVIEELDIELDDADLEELTTLSAAYAAYRKQAEASAGQSVRSEHP